jgi:predicted cupin superfamily sugar epimerase
MPTAADIIRLLGLKPHPEGGYFIETFRDDRMIDGGRAASTAIYFLLARGERSHWHRVDAVEIWHFHAGAPLRLEIAAGARLAGGREPRRLDARRLHGGAWVSVRRI